MNKLELTPIDAYTVNSADDEYRSSDKGIYRSLAIAEQFSKGSGWYGSDGTVESKENVFVDPNGILYEVKLIGYFTDEAQQMKKDLMESIKSKLSPEEFEMIHFKK